MAMNARIGDIAASKRRDVALCPALWIRLHLPGWPVR